MLAQLIPSPGPAGKQGQYQGFFMSGTFAVAMFGPPLLTLLVVEWGTRAGSSWPGCSWPPARPWGRWCAGRPATGPGRPASRDYLTSG